MPHTEIDAVRVLYLGTDENRLNHNRVDALNDQLDQAVATREPVALVLTGIGNYFSNGLDLDWMATGAEDPDAFINDVHDLLHRVLRLDMIPVAAVNGHAFAAGATPPGTVRFCV